MASLYGTSRLPQLAQLTAASLSLSFSLVSWPLPISIARSYSHSCWALRFALLVSLSPSLWLTNSGGHLGPRLTKKTKRKKKLAWAHISAAKCWPAREGVAVVAVVAVVSRFWAKRLDAGQEEKACGKAGQGVEGGGEQEQKEKQEEETKREKYE